MARLCTSFGRLATRVASGLAALGMIALVAAPARAQIYEDTPPGIERVGVDERLDAAIPLDLTFRDHTGATVRLRDLVSGERPVVLNLVYHSCPSFCSLVLDGVLSALKRQAWTVGEDFDVLTISIDPRDTPAIAADKRRRVLAQYGRPTAERGWHFLVAENTLTDDELVRAYGVFPSVERLSEALGFRYQWMPRERQYAHAGVTMLLTPDARIARYLYGIELDTMDVRLGLLEASEGRSISTVERAILYCYRYDGSQQAYVVIAVNVMRIGGAICAILLFGFLAIMWRRDLRKKRRSAAAIQSNSSRRSNEPSVQT